MKKTVAIMLLALLCCPVPAADLAFTVDSDGVTGDYPSLNTWEAAQQQDLTDAGGDTMTVTCATSDGSADTTATSISGWTTGVGNGISVKVDPGSRHGGAYDATKYRIELTNTNLLLITEDYVSIDGVQFQVTATTNSHVGIFYATGINAANDNRVSNCIIKGVITSGDGERGIFAADSDTILTAWNNLIYGFSGAANNNGIDVDGGTTDLYNSTIYNCRNGVRRDGGTVTVKNCIVATNTDDFLGTITVDYCASDDGDGTNAQDAVSGDWDNELTDANNGDFTLVSGGNCIDNGTDDPGGAIQDDTDIAEVAWVSPWSIGAFEFIAAGGDEHTQVMIITTLPALLIIGLFGTRFLSGRKKG